VDVSEKFPWMPRWRALSRLYRTKDMRLRKIMGLQDCKAKFQETLYL
jgi:hypothetical protein